MGYIIAHGACINCKALITFNPNFVPSIRVEGKKEPLCRACFEQWNRIHRTSRGLPAEPLHPLSYEPSEELDL